MCACGSCECDKSPETNVHESARVRSTRAADPRCECVYVQCMHVRTELIGKCNSSNSRKQMTTNTNELQKHIKTHAHKKHIWLIDQLKELNVAQGNVEHLHRVMLTTLLISRQSTVVYRTFTDIAICCNNHNHNHKLKLHLRWQSSNTINDCAHL